MQNLKLQYKQNSVQLNNNDICILSNYTKNITNEYGELNPLKLNKLILPNSICIINIKLSNKHAYCCIPKSIKYEKYIYKYDNTCKQSTLLKTIQCNSQMKLSNLIFIHGLLHDSVIYGDVNIKCNIWLIENLKYFMIKNKISKCMYNILKNIRIVNMYMHIADNSCILMFRNVFNLTIKMIIDKYNKNLYFKNIHTLSITTIYKWHKIYNYTFVNYSISFNNEKYKICDKQTFICIFHKLKYVNKLKIARIEYFNYLNLNILFNKKYLYIGLYNLNGFNILIKNVNILCILLYSYCYKPQNINDMSNCKFNNISKNTRTLHIIHYSQTNVLSKETNFKCVQHLTLINPPLYNSDKFKNVKKLNIYNTQNYNDVNDMYNCKNINNIQMNNLKNIATLIVEKHLLKKYCTQQCSKLNIAINDYTQDMYQYFVSSNNWLCGYY